MLPSLLDISILLYQRFFFNFFMWSFWLIISLFTGTVLPVSFWQNFPLCFFSQILIFVHFPARNLVEANRNLDI